MDGWKLLLELIVALSAALVLGILFEKIKLGAVIGYIVAGTLVGALAKGPAENKETIDLVAELGISILLFSTGLEFSVVRLKKLGRSTLYAGICQIIFSIIVFAGIATIFGINFKSSIAIGAVCAVSSTAIIIRALRDSGDLDASHGKVAFGTLLLQDVAIIPLVILISLMGGVKPPSLGPDWLPKVGGFIFAATVFLVLVMRVVPQTLRSRTVSSNRDLPVLLALVTCIASAWGAHAIGLSPSLGAFLAGMLLADSAFEHQIRSDLAALRSVFVTLFFLSIGMMIDLKWVGSNIGPVALTVTLVLFGKTLANFLAIRLWKRSTITSFAAALTLANVGELGFVLLQLATANGLISPFESQLLTSVTVLTMVAASLIVSTAPAVSRKLAIRLVPRTKLAEELVAERENTFKQHFIVVGFGTAGKTATRILGEAGYPVVAIDLSSKFARVAKELGAVPIVGDATMPDILEELHLNDARAVIVAIPDHRTASLVIAHCRQLCPELVIVARSRNHQFREELEIAGASLVIGEEQLLGVRLGEESVRLVLGVEDEDVRGAAKEIPDD